MDKIISIIGYIVVCAFAAGVVFVLVELILLKVRGKKKNTGKKRVALITGASSGLGREYAVRLDDKLGKNDEIWLIARRADRLQEIAGALKHQARCLSCDLTKDESFARIEALLMKENAEVSYLINCAGFGKIGRIADMPISEQDGMLDLNCSAGMGMVKICLPYMARGSRIMNICSTAGFQPFQSLNVYAASKAFFLRYSRALRMELLPSGISVTAVCPYWIKDTEFIGIAGPEKKSDIRSFPLSSKVSSVAALSLFGSSLNLPVVTPGIVCSFHRLFSKLFPDTVLVYIWELLRRA